MIIPRIKDQKTQNRTLRMPLALTVNAGDDSAKACRLLELFLPQCKAKVSEQALIIGRKTERFSEKPEEYALNVAQEGIKIEYTAYAGLRNALSTLALLAAVQDDALLLPETETQDGPACSHRGVMLDPARGNPPFEEFCNVLILAAKCKMNLVHIHLAENVGLSVEMDCLPAHYRHENCYTKEQVRQLNELCEILGLEIIPEFDMPAHATKLIELYPNLACTPSEDVVPSHWAICTGTEETYALYEKIIAEVLELFPKGRYFHMGGDELEFADLAHKRPHSLCHWTVCSKCKEFRKKHGLKDRTEQYYYFANRINEIVKRHGRQMMMWSDQIDCTRPAGLSKDILMHFWRIAHPGRGPYDGCSFNEQLNLGYTLVNSYYPETYTDEEPYINDEKIRTWRWDERPKCTDGNKKNVIGSELCAWNYGDPDPKYAFHDRVFPAALALMGDKLWNGDELPYSEEYDGALTRTVLGASTPAGLNVFRGIGAKIPPRTEAWSYPDRVTCTEEELIELEKQLTRADCYAAGDAFRAKIYAKCIRYTIENRKAKNS
ncbi:MAG: family 20 glycosylhydrolase [Clostridia bacterium]|nr:family 20 glycosylhydrolase [Clostridia bacterium]